MPSNRANFLRRRAVFGGLTAFAAAGALPPVARAADSWPSRPVHIIVPFAPGGSSDILVRLVAAKMGPMLKENIIIENKPGAGGMIGADYVAHAKPDGYTFLAAQVGTLAYDPALYKDVPYDPIKSFKPVAQQSEQPNLVVVNAALPVHSVAELVAYAKANPGKLNYSSAGVGSDAHISTAYFAYTTGIDIVHVPFVGTGPSLVALMSGEAQLTITGPLPVMPAVKSGKLRILAVTTLKRLAFLPDVPTVAESGYSGFESVAWTGIVAPADTSDEIVRKFHDTSNAVLSDPEFVAQLREQGAEPVTNSSAQFGALIQNDLKKWGDVIRKLNIKT